MQQRALVGGMVSLISGLASAIFIWIGFEMLTPADTALTLRAVGALSLSYGGASGLLLWRAWRSPAPYLPVAARWLALVFLTAVILNAMDNDALTKLEVSGVALAAILVFSNWLAVKRVTGLRRR